MSDQVITILYYIIIYRLGSDKRPEDVYFKTKQKHTAWLPMCVQSWSFWSTADTPSPLPWNLGQAPLHLAARKGHIEVVELLLKSGASVGNADEFGRGPHAERLRRLSPVQCESTTHPMIPRFYATLVRGRTWPRGGGQTAAAVGRLRRGEDQGRPGPQLRSSLSVDPLSRWWQRGLINSKSQRTCAGRVWFYMILWYFMNGQCGRQNCWILFFLFSCSILMAQERLWFVVRVWWIIVETC